MRGPGVATRIPGNVDLIRDRETGLLVEPGDAEGLARAVADLAADAVLREKLGRAARAFVEERFDMEGVARKYAEMYRESAARGGVTVTA